VTLTLSGDPNSFNKTQYAASLLISLPNAKTVVVSIAVFSGLRSNVKTVQQKFEVIANITFDVANNGNTTATSQSLQTQAAQASNLTATNMNFTVVSVRTVDVTTPAQTASTATSSGSTATSKDNKSGGDDDQSLAIGAGVGIGLGLPIVVLAIVVAVIYYRRRAQPYHKSMSRFEPEL